MKTLATLVFAGTAVFATTGPVQAAELSLPSVTTQTISTFASELLQQQMTELKTAIAEQSQKAIAELKVTLESYVASEKAPEVAAKTVKAD
jgi:hypothetical protein